jgi:hypothetical protein
MRQSYPFVLVWVAMVWYLTENSHPSLRSIPDLASGGIHPKLSLGDDSETPLKGNAVACI